MRGAGTEMQKGAIEKIVNVIGFVNVANCEPSSMVHIITDQKFFTSTEKKCARMFFTKACCGCAKMLHADDMSHETTCVPTFPPRYALCRLFKKDFATKRALLDVRCHHLVPKR